MGRYVTERRDDGCFRTYVPDAGEQVPMGAGTPVRVDCPYELLTPDERDALGRAAGVGIGVALVGSVLSLGAWIGGIYWGHKLLRKSKCERPETGGRS